MRLVAVGPKQGDQRRPRNRGGREGEMGQQSDAFGLGENRREATPVRGPKVWSAQDVQLEPIRFSRGHRLATPTPGQSLVSRPSDILSAMRLFCNQLRRKNRISGCS